VNSHSAQRFANGAAAVEHGLSVAVWAGEHLESLLALARPGNIHAFNELIRTYERSLYLVSLSIAGNPESAERIALQAVYRAFNSLSKLAAPESLSLWLIEIAIAVGRELVGRLAPQVGLERSL